MYVGQLKSNAKMLLFLKLILQLYNKLFHFFEVVSISIYAKFQPSLPILKRSVVFLFQDTRSNCLNSPCKVFHFIILLIFEFFFDFRKQKKITRSQFRTVGWVRKNVDSFLFQVLGNCFRGMWRSIIVACGTRFLQSFLMLSSS